ncbi:MAG: Gfo/Idh/MocA family oxidoreductase [Clostridium sp.]|nr:Gfo/Idh/MocA family oxidoreductase [Clostridium sp.]
MKKMNYGVIGTGYFGKELAKIMNEVDGAQVTCVYDPYHGEEVAKELGCQVEEVLEYFVAREDIDAVIVASPNYLHKEHVMAALRHKKHIFCEKPIALTYQDCDEMVETAKEIGVTFMAGHVMHFFNGVRKARQLIEDGEIGDLLFAHSARNGWEEPKETISWKKIAAKSGGHLYHHIHELDCIQLIMGEAKTVTMAGGNVAHQSNEFGDEDDMLLLTLEFGDDKYALVEYGSAFRWSEHYILIQGTKGAIKLNMQETGVTLKNDEGVTKFLLHETKEEDEDRTNTYKEKASDGAIIYGKPGTVVPLWLRSIMVREMEFFNKILRGEEVEQGYDSLLSGEAAKASIRTADAAHVSLRENRKVSIDEIRAK